MKEIMTGSGSIMDSKELKQILDLVSKSYNDKVKEEREADKGKKKSNKPALKQGKQTVNNKMMQNMMGNSDYGSEDESGAGGKRIAEEEFDFM